MENIYQGDVADLELILPRLNIRLLTPQIVFRHNNIIISKTLPEWLAEPFIKE